MSVTLKVFALLELVILIVGTILKLLSLVDFSWVIVLLPAWGRGLERLLFIILNPDSD